MARAVQKNKLILISSQKSLGVKLINRQPDDSERSFVDMDNNFNSIYYKY